MLLTKGDVTSGNGGLNLFVSNIQSPMRALPGVSALLFSSPSTAVSADCISMLCWCWCDTEEWRSLRCLPSPAAAITQLFLFWRILLHIVTEPQTGTLIQYSLVIIWVVIGKKKNCWQNIIHRLSEIRIEIKWRHSILGVRPVKLVALSKNN